MPRSALSVGLVAMSACYVGLPQDDSASEASAASTSAATATATATAARAPGAGAPVAGAPVAGARGRRLAGLEAGRQRAGRQRLARRRRAGAGRAAVCPVGHVRRASRRGSGRGGRARRGRGGRGARGAGLAGGVVLGQADVAGGHGHQADAEGGSRHHCDLVTCGAPGRQAAPRARCRYDVSARGAAGCGPETLWGPDAPRAAAGRGGPLRAHRRSWRTILRSSASSSHSATSRSPAATTRSNAGLISRRVRRSAWALARRSLPGPAPELPSALR